MTLLQQSWKFNFEKKNFVATMEKIVATKIWGQRSLLQQCAHRVAIMKIDLQPSGHERWSNVQFSNKISTQQCFPLRGKHCCVEFCCWIQTILVQLNWFQLTLSNLFFTVPDLKSQCSRWWRTFIFCIILYFLKDSQENHHINFEPSGCSIFSYLIAHFDKCTVYFILSVQWILHFMHSGH